jgi:acyl-CoA synthetase (AMP-forming)/AMP-acid ligase II
LSAPLDAVGLAEDVMPFGHLMLRSARRAPEKEALVFPDARLTYRQLADRAWAIAGSLHAMGVEPGQHVGILMTNHPDLVASVIGISLIGAVVVPINARYRAAEVDFVARDAELVAILTHDCADAHVDFAALLREALSGRTNPPTVVMLGAKSVTGLTDRATFDQLGADADQAAVQHAVERVELSDVALILYTSGTTSHPRGVMLSHEAFVRTWMSTGRIWRTGPEDRHYSALPLFHITALGCVTWVLGCGATFYSDATVDPRRCLETLERERITEFYPAYQPVMEAVLAEAGFADADLSSIRVFLNVAPPEVLARFQRALPHAVQMTTYGGTECGPAALTRLDDPLDVRINTCGSPQPGMELRVVGEDGRALGPGERGVVQVRGFHTLDGYWNAPEKTAETVLDDGWVSLGDLGVLDEHGRVLFLGRLKETLKVGGENVAPQEVEEHLATHPAVGLVQVVGIPDDRLIEVPAAFVELLPGHEATEQELIAHCRGRIASFKVPRLIRFVEPNDWPMSATKIQRFRLRDRLLAELAERPLEKQPTAR